VLAEDILNSPEVRDAREMDDGGVDLFWGCFKESNLGGGFDPTRHEWTMRWLIGQNVSQQVE
jgi:hypothetical protein